MIKAKLVEIQVLNKTTKTFLFKPDSKPDHLAGQFTELRIKHEKTDQRGDKRWFTLSSSPSEELLAITTKFSDQGSSFKRQLAATSLETQFDLATPMGDFVLPKDKSITLNYIVGGIGITPVRSMTKWLQDNNDKRKIRILYGANTEEDILFADLFNYYGAELTPVISKPKSNWTGLSGHLERPILDQFIKADTEGLYYISGPESMLEAVTNMLLVCGIKRHQLVTDYFPGY